jgi:hypothetical protein
MKSLAKYLAESERTYHYRIRVVGDVPADFFKSFREKLAQFDLIKMSDVKTAPVRKVVPGFPAFPNQSLSLADIEVRYPAVEPQIKQLAQLMGMDPNRITMNTISYDDSLEQEQDQISKQNKDLLKNTDYPAADKKQQQLKQDHAAPAHDHEVLKNAYRSEFTVAGGRTPAAKTTNDLPQGTKSPMTTIKRPPKPATGAQPSRG